MEITIPIVVSVIALIVSILSFQWNKAKYNLDQLQNKVKNFCDNLQRFNELGTVSCLTSYKFEIENLYYINDIEKHNIAYNSLQLEFSKRKEDCLERYKGLMETLDFFEIQGLFENNDFVKWLNKTLNDYHQKLNQFYGDLLDINLIVKAAEKDLLTEERKKFVNLFFDNIRDLLDYNYAFCVFKRDVSGYFGKLSLSDVGLFGKTKSALKLIENKLINILVDYGFDDAINKKEYSKIRKHCPDFGYKFDEMIAEERADFMKFLNIVKNQRKNS